MTARLLTWIRSHGVEAWVSDALRGEITVTILWHHPITGETGTEYLRCYNMHGAREILGY